MNVTCCVVFGLVNCCVLLCEQVTGEANETQICEALRRYSEREGFVREALFHLFSLTHVMEKPRPDILKVNPHHDVRKRHIFYHA